jgi:hypothetical protein
MLEILWCIYVLKTGFGCESSTYLGLLTKLNLFLEFSKEDGFPILNTFSKCPIGIISLLFLRKD